jgi:hypothetical protein
MFLNIKCLGHIMHEKTNCTTASSDHVAAQGREQVRSGKSLLPRRVGRAGNSCSASG